MEDGKSPERTLSQKAFQMSTSSSCQMCALGFLSGLCLAFLFLAAGFRAAISFSAGSVPLSSVHPIMRNQRERVVYYQTSDENENVSLLYTTWTILLRESNDHLSPTKHNNVPKPPHLEDCMSRVEMNRNLDVRRLPNETYPPWTLWEGMLDGLPRSETPDDQLPSQGAYPPWITGSDAENYPLTRKTQRDLWLHQHPVNCMDPSVKFLVADWERPPGFGIGAQLAGMCGLLAIAINEKRVLVTGYYNRADHDGCKGSLRSSWSCYFFPETSTECKKRAYELMRDKGALEKGVVTRKYDYTSRDIWTAQVPRTWGKPWRIMQPTTEINGSLIVHHRKMDRRWWRAQAIRYLMRFKTEYTCNLMNIARHSAFGREAAKMVVESSSEWKDVQEKKHGIEEFVWSNHKPWIPRPLLSIHVRMGDKACEMKVVGFEEYIRLADKVRRRFPQLNRVWLSTEMQDVIDRAKSYRHWKFYYTNVTRQNGNMTMAMYEASLGRETSTNYPLVNFLMAADADLFIGALGSTWCFLIDGMRNTGGKVMSGYLSVNKDRFW